MQDKEEKYGEEGAREYLQHLQDDFKCRFGHLPEDVEKLVDDNLKYFGRRSGSDCRRVRPEVPRR